MIRTTAINVLAVAFLVLVAQACAGAATTTNAPESARPSGTQPTAAPTATPTKVPTPEPTTAPTATPTAMPTPTPTTVPTPSIPRLTVRSDPPGATVETGIQCVNLVVTPGTGRTIGTTPVEAAPISDDDLAECPSGVFALYTEIRLAGYKSTIQVKGFGSSDHIKPDDYTIDVILQP